MDGRAERGERGVREGIKRPSPSAIRLGVALREYHAGLRDSDDQELHVALAVRLDRLLRVERENPARCPCGARVADHE